MLHILKIVKQYHMFQILLHSFRLIEDEDNIMKEIKCSPSHRNTCSRMLKEASFHLPDAGHIYIQHGYDI